ncbi:trehalase family glycosidase [Shigella flexneri]
MPSCLNSESAIANISALKGEKETEALFRQKASARRDAVNRYLWDDETASTAITTGDANNWRCFPLPPLCPLDVGMANHEQADSVWVTPTRPVTDTWRDSGKPVRNR